jgi:hypothetical protein
MNRTYPYPIDHARYIPSSLEDAQQAYDELLNHTDLKSLDNPTFLRGWFALHFLCIGPHPDNASDWDDMIRPILDEAWRRYKIYQMREDQFYCSDSQHQGLRLQKTDSLLCHVEGKLAGQSGYVSGQYDTEQGNVPILTGVSGMAYMYESPKKAWEACRHLDLDRVIIYASHPDRDMDCPPMIDIPMKEVEDIEVVIQTEEGLYLYRDGKTLGDSHVLACKYQLHADNVEQQIQQVKTTLGVTWTWVEYATIQ